MIHILKNTADTRFAYALDLEMYSIQRIRSAQAWLRKIVPWRKIQQEKLWNVTNNSKSQTHPGTVQRQWNSYSVKAHGF